MLTNLLLPHPHQRLQLAALAPQVQAHPSLLLANLTDAIALPAVVDRLRQLAVLYHALPAGEALLVFAGVVVLQLHKALVLELQQMRGVVLSGLQLL